MGRGEPQGRRPRHDEIRDDAGYVPRPSHRSPPSLLSTSKAGFTAGMGARMTACPQCHVPFKPKRTTQKFCCRPCLYASQRGEGHHSWKGDQASRRAGRSRALRLFANRPCEACDAPTAERHHEDGNPLNNDPANVRMLCRPCHLAQHDFVEIGGRGKSKRPIEVRRAYQREYMREWRRKRAA